MSFTLGSKSNAALVGVHPIIANVVRRAIVLTSQDFAVNEGCRSLDRQKKLVAAGASKTLKSMHIPGPDRYGKLPGDLGHAVDLVPYIDGALRWEWGPIYNIAAAMAQAAREQAVGDKLCWGGVWDRWMAAYMGDAAEMKAAVTAYTARHPGPDFIDGPHFQIGRLG